MKKLSLIVAVDAENGIGLNGDLPWHLPEDLKHFKKITTKVKAATGINAVIMGRKTWESIPEKFRPLRGRLNIVMSRQEAYELPEGVLLCRDFEAVQKALAEHADIEHAFLIGGAELFKQAFDRDIFKDIFLTRIDASFGCDVFFPELTHERFSFEELKKGEEDGVAYVFYHLKPKSE